MTRLPDLLPTRLVADMLEVSIGRISQLAASRGIVPTIVAGRRFWTQEQVTQLRPRKTGRPRKASKAGKDVTP
jgi:hypothetical protein